MSAARLRVACVQLNTRQDTTATRLTALDLVRRAAADGARLVALPETWVFKGDRAGILESAEPLTGPSNTALADLAGELGIWVLAGSIYEPSAVAGRVHNASALFGPDGELRAAYRKIHLFDITAGDRVYRESDEVAPGGEIVTAEVDGVLVGLTICYDVRFPELYRALALRGARVIFVPAAFSAITGPSHWEILLRARAIENGCFVVAPDQVGEHLPGYACHGHSLVIDPWGRVLAERPDGVGLCVADLDLGLVDEVRGQIPTLEHLRADVYRD